VNDRQLGERLRRAFEREQPPAVSAAEILQRAEATQSAGHHADVQDRELTGTRLDRPARIPSEGHLTLGGVALGHQDRQRRELEEIRRSFAEIGTRMGSLFEPAQERQAREVEHEESVEPTVQATPAGRRMPRWAVPAVLGLALVCLLVGGGLGYLLHRPTTAAEGPAAGMPATSIVTRVVPSPPQTRVVAPPACLETARRADELMDLFTRNIRDRRLSLALKEYTLASQACRKKASP
jgi:hypothetical protein